MEKDAALLLVSRGVIECERRSLSSAEEFGLKALGDLFQGASVSGAKALCAYILSSVCDFRGKSPQCDDQTALALVRTA
jgi:serine phosphatase RsbU (regulator of sigma subunit)